MTPMAERAMRSILADHIRGTRKHLRRLRAEAATKRAKANGPWGPDGGVRWLEGLIYGTESELRDLRDLSAVLRGRA